MNESSEYKFSYIVSLKSEVSSESSTEMYYTLISTCEYETVSLYSGKIFSTWKTCERLLNEYAKEQGFHIVKDRVYRAKMALFVDKHFYVITVILMIQLQVSTLKRKRHDVLFLLIPLVQRSRILRT
ncbi:5057_t:CDS:2 [Ambispora gerdemannii]|uniref:5057_t:CDS:1 n=1 Tax=Ambispora gerdemannii TaxID=144530 RepID=A0A9N9FE44_9GLOM|nr:5057_t:CDS:2 [Ambispora gerdemannii]